MQHEISARLRALLPPVTPMPAPGGWAVAADLLLYLIDTIRRCRPAQGNVMFAQR